MIVSLSAFLLFSSATAITVPTIELKNAAVPGTRMPVIGLGTGCYAHHPNEGSEFWNNSIAAAAVAAWLQAGGRRIDTAYTYWVEVGVGQAINSQTAVRREEIFITSKVGRGLLGYNETLAQFREVLRELNVSYVDLLLIHWPGPLPTNSTDPKCQPTMPSGRPCRQSSWLAVEEIFKSGRAKAIGVSNFEENHLQDIFDLNSLWPALNQFEYHPYWHENDLVQYCHNHSIAVNSYSPLGTPDWAPRTHGWNSTILDLPLIKEIAANHSKSPAQVILRWAWHEQIVANPRSWNAEHMVENLNIFDFELSDEERAQISAVPKPESPKVCPDPHAMRFGMV